MKKPHYLLICLLGFLGVGALGGGGVLIASPGGELMGMPLSMLCHSPFRTFLVPGILLFAVIGICPSLLVVALLKKPSSAWADRLNLFPDMHWSWTFTLYAAFSLIIWIQLEMVFLQAVHWLHTFYMFYAILLIVVSVSTPVRRTYANP